jgi:putative addiction module antidote
MIPPAVHLSRLAVEVGSRGEPGKGMLWRWVMTALKLIGVGNSVGVVLPKDLLARLGLQKGDTVYAVDTPDGVRLTTADAEFESQMKVARRLMDKWRNVFHELAK